jgi:hypothetical protein
MTLPPAHLVMERMISLLDNARHSKWQHDTFSMRTTQGHREFEREERKCTACQWKKLRPIAIKVFKVEP